MPQRWRIPARLATGNLRGGSATAMKLWRTIEAGRVTQSVPPDGGAPAGAGGKALWPVVPAHQADALIALAVAVLGAGGALGARHQGEHVPVAATVILAAMGLILYARRRFPGSVLVVMALLVAGLVALGTSLEGGFIAVLISSYGAAVYGSRRLAF